MKRIISVSISVLVVFIVLFNISILSTNRSLVSINVEAVKAIACENMEGVQAVILLSQECIVSSSGGVTVYGCEDADSTCGD